MKRAQYGALTNIAKALNTSKQNVSRVKRQLETGIAPFSPLSKKIAARLFKTGQINDKILEKN